MILNTTIQLRRDNEYNFEKIKKTFIPANGEVILVDTAKNGLRAKVGDGYSTWEKLTYTDESSQNVVIHGYLYNNNFYKDSQYQALITGMVNKIYIDKNTRKIYFFNGVDYINIQSDLVTATASIPGIVKLYGETGQNVDGTMTQKAITDELNLRYKTTIDSKNELLVFSF